MQILEEKKIVIKLPRIRIRSFLSVRFAAVFALLLFCFAFSYWYRNVRPYLSIPHAHINAYSALLSSDRSGRIASMGPQEGEQIKKGDFLFSFERKLPLFEEKKASLKLLKQRIDFEKERMIKAMEGYLSAASDFEMGIGGKENVEKHLNLLEEAQRSSDEAQLKAGILQKELDSKEDGAAEGIFCAPFDGVILKRYKNEGEVCSLGDRVYTVCDLNRLWIEAEIPETQLSQIKIGTPARIRLFSCPQKDFHGKISYIGSATSAKSEQLPIKQFESVIPIKISFEVKDASFKPGLGAKVDLKIR